MYASAYLRKALYVLIIYVVVVASNQKIYGGLKNEIKF